MYTAFNMLNFVPHLTNSQLNCELESRGDDPFGAARTWTLRNDMKCPHCSVGIHADWKFERILQNVTEAHWYLQGTLCPECGGETIDIQKGLIPTDGGWQRVYPQGATRRRSPPSEVPAALASDYSEAAAVLHISSKASAALSRRCLQAILRAQGYRARDLAAEIDLFLNEPDPAKGIPTGLRDTVDAIRNFGNFSAHPITDVTQLQVIDVEPHEAEWCLEIIEELFQHFYVRPAEAAARKAALNVKLAAAGKPPAK